jgi:hypothetical protein
MTTIFMVYPRLSTIQSCDPGQAATLVGLVPLKSATLGVFALHARAVDDSGAAIAFEKKPLLISHCGPGAILGNVMLCATPRSFGMGKRP